MPPKRPWRFLGRFHHHTIGVINPAILHCNFHRDLSPLPQAESPVERVRFTMNLTIALKPACEARHTSDHFRSYPYSGSLRAAILRPASYASAVSCSNQAVELTAESPVSSRSACNSVVTGFLAAARLAD
jgi:hypothetical protein